MDFYKHQRFAGLPRSIHYSFVYLLAVIFSYHTLIVAYNTSSFAAQFVSPTAVGVLHAGAALGAVGLFIIFPKLLARFGNVALGIGVMAASVLLLLILAFAAHGALLLLALALFLVLNPLVYLIIDVFSETLIGQSEGETGKKRGLTLSLMSAAAVFAPLSMGLLMGDNGDFTPLFFASAGVGLLFVAVLMMVFRQFYDPVYTHPKLTPLLTAIRSDKNLLTVMSCHFLLQLFFAWIIIYVPLYLSTIAGFTWSEIGIIISSGLLAYVLFEYPTGIIADRYLGEQEMMSLGFMILAVTTAFFGVLGAAPLFVWMLIMFINRFGASLVEVTTESYFFKHVDGSSADLMSVFRLLRPLANVAGALIGAVSLAFMPFSVFFMIGGLILVAGVYLPRFLVDTR
jgi:MFS family permease